MIPTLFGMSMIAFLIIQLPPGDYLTSMLASMADSGQTVDPAQMARLREIYGLDDPIWLQYWKWITGIIFRGDFGYSFEWNRPVSELIWERMGSTLTISLASLLFVWAVSLPIGIYSAVRRHSVGDYVFTFLGFLGLAIPNFILALTLMYLVLPLLRPERRRPLLARVSSMRPGPGPSSSTCSAHLWIPIIVIGTNGTAALIRILRANLTDELNKPYVITARPRACPSTRWC